MNNVESPTAIMKDSLQNEAYRAAYALNMCTVSVSQIIDYEDINVLEQEYEAILNNLNLEMMPKDDALLSIIKNLLDTITFFRISEGDKKMIEREYEHKTRNAIWSAIPNFGMIFTGGVSPVSLGLSLASQIGLGYMNYRRNKSEYVFEREKEHWKLQRTAIEQFNGLRRELFSTAWRLADKFAFPDNYRLSEKQIKQYNEILNDDDDLRMFERLEFIKDGFFAYPPFWYYFGHTANQIYRDTSYPEEIRSYYKDKAKEAFETYWSVRNSNILREDTIMSSCALEYIELLDFEQDKEKILSLLQGAIKSSPNSYDVLQICAFNFLQLNDYYNSERLFRFLVNENYNKKINAQMLSQLYVNQYIANKKNEIKSKYEILAIRMNGSYIFPFPGDSSDISELSNQFINIQKRALSKSFDSLSKQLFQSYIIKLNGIFPSTDKESSESYYSNEKTLKKYREDSVKYYLNLSSDLGISYSDSLKNINLQGELISTMNQILDTFRIMSSFIDLVEINSIYDSTCKVLQSNVDTINEGQIKLKTGHMTIDLYKRIEDAFEQIVRELFTSMMGLGRKHIKDILTMKQINQFEYDLMNVCQKEQISIDILSTDDYTSRASVVPRVPDQHFSVIEFGARALVNQRKLNDKVRIAKIVKDNMNSIAAGGSDASIEVYVCESNAFREYMRKNPIYKNAEEYIAAIISDTYGMIDIIFTLSGIIIKQNKKNSDALVTTVIEYRSIELINDRKINYPDGSFKYDRISMNALYNMITEIRTI